MPSTTGTGYARMHTGARIPDTIVPVHRQAQLLSGKCMRDLPKYPVPWANRSTTGASVGRFVPGLVRRTPLSTFF